MNYPKNLALLPTVLLALAISGVRADAGCFCNLCDRSAQVIRQHQAEEQVLCVVAAGARQRSNQNQFRALVNCAVEQWRCRDGALNYTISDAFLDLLQQEPKVFFEVMNHNRYAFEEWSKQLGTLSFTNLFGSSTSRLEAKRLHLIKFLKELKVTEANELVLKELLLKRLEAIVPSAVD